ncbi:MAG: hypothetical protein CR986_02970 [Ignavibacteriae bacterium]|nr:MAG: hypothetical protein CR986_02970 [Ignavibacteriota bacterium]
MLLNLKNKLFESIIILYNIANKEPDILPKEISIFLTEEFNLVYSAVFIEDKENSFKLLGNSIAYSTKENPTNLSISDYDELKETSKFEKMFFKDCTINFEAKNLQSIVLWNKNYKYLLLLQHKSVVDKEFSNKFKNVLIFVNYLLKAANQNFSNIDVYSKSVSSILKKTNFGFSKELKTINGLLTLIREENISTEVENYLDEIKIITNSLLKTTNDLSDLLELGKYNIALNEISIDLNEFLSNLGNKIKTERSNGTLEVKNNVSCNFEYDQKILEYLLNTSTYLTLTLSKSKIVRLKTSITSENNLRLNFSAETVGLSREILDEITNPFNIKKVDSGKSGLTITLLEKYLEKLNGKLNIFEENNTLNINLSFPVKVINNSSEEKNIIKKSDIKKEKILVVNSEESSSQLLKKHLNKWDFHVEYSNNAESALNMLKKEKYVASILNIEQENNNGLEILAKIKSDNQTRNIPVIVFTLEPETEKVYTMGTVDFLIKPINYNNLVEILTSYKIKRSSTVLCVDDDIPTLNLIKQAVQTAGFNAIIENRPELVLEKIKEQNIDLAIIDLAMPIISGFDLIIKIKSDNKYSNLPIIIYTGKEDYHDELQKINGMFDDLLEKKSTSINELEKSITDMINSFENKTKNPENIINDNGPVILMAEDYKHSQIIVSRILKKNGFENIIVVENGAKALEICKAQKIDLVLMDMQMPVMNGFEATGKIRELPAYKETPIIALTAFAMKGDREKCLDAGATDYIPKPIDSKEFLEKVKYYTEIGVKI